MGFYFWGVLNSDLISCDTLRSKLCAWMCRRARRDHAKEHAYGAKEFACRVRSHTSVRFERRTNVASRRKTTTFHAASLKQLISYAVYAA